VTESKSEPTDWVEQSDIHHTDAKQNGNDAEQWVQDHYGLEGQDTSICPSYAHDVMDPRTGTPGEVKSCQIRYNNDGGRGRFQIWDYAHETLLEHGGFYVFVVHEPKAEQMHVYFHRPLAASQVDALIGNWHAIDHRLRPDEAHRTELSQSAVFSDIQISRIDPGEAEEPAAEAGEVVEEASTPQGERMETTIETIREVEAQHDEDLAPHSAVIAALESKGISESKANHDIDQLKKRGEIYEPRTSAYRVT